MIIACIIVFLAAMCNAVMDTCVHHYNRSVFAKWSKDESYWNGEISWMNKYVNGNPMRGRRTYKIPKYRITWKKK